MTRRDCLALAPLLISGACSRSKGSGYFGYAFVATAGDNALAVVDLMAFRLLPAIRLGAPPVAVIAAPSIGCSYVLTPSTDSVHVVDQTLNRVAAHRLGSGLAQIQLASDGRNLFGLCHRSREIVIAETGLGKTGSSAASLPVVRRFKVDGEPLGFDISRTGYIAVFTSVPGMVELFHSATGQRTRAQIPDPISALRFRDDGKLLLVARPHDRSVTALDVPSLRIVAELPLAMQPDNLCFSADRGQLFVSGTGMDAVAVVFPYDTLEVDQTVLAGRDPGVMTCSENPNYLFVASATGSDVSIMSVDNYKVLGIVEVGGKPVYLAITPDNQYALVFDETNGNMAVIRIPAIGANIARSPANHRFKLVASLFTMLNVGTKPVHAAIMPRRA
jgi:DNA-binding beta-propeller fold protein YncE